MNESEKMLERAMTLSELAVAHRNGPENQAHYAAASRDLVSAYTRLKDVEFAQHHIDLYNKQNAEAEESFSLPGEAPLVNPNN
jgi:hypothetical protein